MNNSPLSIKFAHVKNKFDFVKKKKISVASSSSVPSTAAVPHSLQLRRAGLVSPILNPTLLTLNP
jgi:hypothetical protein